MSDRPDQHSEQPLFQNIDEQERVYAPQQVPGAVSTPSEVDAGGSAGGNTALPSQQAGTQQSDTEPHRPHIAGAEGDQRTAPVVAVRPDVSGSTSIALPVDTDAQRSDDSTGRT